jgi:hypothetical protein
MKPNSSRTLSVDAADRNLGLDEVLRETGVVSPKLFLQFAAVEDDPNASSVGWLDAKLQVLAARVARGGHLLLYSPQLGRSVAVSTVDELVKWTSENFPVIGFKL